TQQTSLTTLPDVTRDLCIQALGSAVWTALVVTSKRLLRFLDRQAPGLGLPIYYAVVDTYLVVNIVVSKASRAFVPCFLCSTAVLSWLHHRDISTFWKAGIIGADQQTGAGFGYKAALTRCNDELVFMGLGAFKLTSQDPQFEEAVVRCSNRQVRLL